MPIRTTHGWTGGQYSAYRAVLSLTVAFLFVRLATSAAPGHAAIWTLAALACLPVAVGQWDRWIAPLPAAACLLAQTLQPPGPGWPLLAGLLVLHVSIPGRPYGALSARGRSDPGGGWRLPSWSRGIAWIVLTVGSAVDGALILWGQGIDLLGEQRYTWARLAPFLPGLAGSGWERWLAWPLGAFELALPACVLFPRARRWCWLALLLALPLRYVAAHTGTAAGPPVNVGWLLLVLLASDPGWIPPAGSRDRRLDIDRVYYDGNCGLCHRAVRFLIAEDPQGRMFRFAPLGGASIARLLPEATRARLPDSLVVVGADGGVRTRGDAIVYCARRLGGLWRILGGAARLAPGDARNRMYDVIARHRRRFFAAPADACPVQPAGLRSRFDD